MLDEIREHVHDPHPKKKLREQCYKDLCDNRTIAERLFLKSVWYKIKRAEIAKPDKYPRMIGDLGVAASLQGFRLTEILKNAQASEELEFDGGIIRFVKTPQPHVLKDVFDKLMNPPGVFYYVYFSDDAVYSRREGGKVKISNIDISSCDGSHGPEVFKALIDIVPIECQDDMKILVDQCSKPIRIVSTANPNNSILMKPTTPRLYSGATITTAINNIANIAIAVAIRGHPNKTPAQAAREAGYIITEEECEIPEDIQFLKCSPVCNIRGEYHPVMNLGVLLRLSGQCKGDLPGRGSIRDRAIEFQSGLLRSYMPWARWNGLNQMRKNFGVTPRKEIQRAVDDLFEYKLEGDYPAQDFTDEALLRRYRLDETGTYDVNLFFGMRHGEHIATPELGKVLMKDYKLSCANGLGCKRVLADSGVPPLFGPLA